MRFSEKIASWCAEVQIFMFCLCFICFEGRNHQKNEGPCNSLTDVFFEGILQNVKICDLF